MTGLPIWLWLAMAITGLLILIKSVSLLYHRRILGKTGTAQSRQKKTAFHANKVSRSNARETGPMVYFAKDGHEQTDKIDHEQIDNEYQFNYKVVGGSWQAYILKTPSFGQRDSSYMMTYRFYDQANAAACISWDKPVASLKVMQAISRVWADGMQRYITTGERFG